MSKKPEGLSPSYGSFIDKDISETYSIKWQPREKQTQAIVYLYNASGSQLASHTVSGGATTLSPDTLYGIYALNTAYYWAIKTHNGTAWSDTTEKQLFYVRSIPKGTPITWTTNPKSNQVIIKNNDLLDIKTNIIRLMSSYGPITSSDQRKIDSLFTGIIVPLREDFNSIQYLLQVIGEKEGIAYKNDAGYYHITEKRPNRDSKKWSDTQGALSNTWGLQGFSNTIQLEVIKWLNDGLGVSDIHNVRSYLHMLTNAPPLEPTGVNIHTKDAQMYTMKSISATSDGRLDATVDLNVSVNPMTENSSLISFGVLSKSKDIRFYEIKISYGPLGTYNQKIYMRKEDVENKNLTLQTKWSDLFDANTLSKARHTVEIVAIDKYNNMSTPLKKEKTYGSNYVVPIGFKSFEIESQKTAMTSTSYDDKNWSFLYSGTKSSFELKASGREGKYFYRARAVDLSGLKTDWVYSGGVLFDPLLAPDTPKTFTVTATTDSTISLSWSSSTRAEKYELRTAKTGGTLLQNTSSRTYKRTGLNDNTRYNFYVRAVNRRGSSAWKHVSGKTKVGIVEKIWTDTHTHSYIAEGVAKPGYLGNEGKGHTYVYHGSKSTKYRGMNYKGIVYFDYGNIRSTLKGKEILNVWIELERIKGGSSSAGKPMFFLGNTREDKNDFPYLRDRNRKQTSLATESHINKFRTSTSFKIGQKKWVALPKEFVEQMRDGWGTSIVLFSTTTKPYMVFSNKARLKVRYK